MSVSPYTAPGFYDQALAKGRHRDIVGGRWEETGRIVLPVLDDLGLRSDDQFLDIGAGSLRLGCRLVPWLQAGHYWATDASGALMRRGWQVELTESDRTRLPVTHLVEDADFAFPGVPDDITFALAFAVFTHLPMNYLRRALISVRTRFPRLRRLAFTVFIAPDAASFGGAVRQPDGVVTHPDRAPWHMLAEDVLHLTRASGFAAVLRPDRLPRGQVMVVADPD